MPRNFLVAPLPAGHIDQAFPVVQALDPAMTPEQWHAIAAAFAHAEPDADAPRGIMACRMGTGHIRGLFCYALDEVGTLAVGPFAVAGLFDTRATAEGLIEAIGQLARRFGALRVTVGLSAGLGAAIPHSGLPALFRGHGYRQDGGVLVRDAPDIEAEQRAPLATA